MAHSQANRAVTSTTDQLGKGRESGGGRGVNADVFVVAESEPHKKVTSLEEMTAHIDKHG